MIDRRTVHDGLKPVFFNIEKVLRTEKVHTRIIATLGSNGASRRAWEQRKPVRFV